MRKLFGTDGVRGVANTYPMTTEIAMQLGRAIAFLVKQQKTDGKHSPRIVIGKDTRLSGYMIENALASGICSMGVNVLLVGPLPTPGIAFITTGMRADAGVVISASHNPFQDNGIKIFSKNGFKLPDEEEAIIEDLIFSKKMDSLRPVAEEVTERVDRVRHVDVTIAVDVAVFIRGRYRSTTEHTTNRQQTHKRHDQHQGYVPCH